MHIGVTETHWSHNPKMRGSSPAFATIIKTMQKKFSLKKNLNIFLISKKFEVAKFAILLDNCAKQNTIKNVFLTKLVKKNLYFTFFFKLKHIHLPLNIYFFSLKDCQLFVNLYFADIYLIKLQNKIFSFCILNKYFRMLKQTKLFNINFIMGI